MSLTLALRATEREARVWAKVWRSGVFTTFVAPVLMLLALGVGMGQLVESDPAELGGLDYLAFVTPGLMVATAMQTAAGNSLWPVMSGHRWLGTYYSQSASPMGSSDIYAGQVVWTGAKALLQSVVFLLVGMALGGVLSPWGVLAIPAAALTAVAIGAPLAAFAATQDSDAAFDVLLRVVIVPMYLFSGTLFAIDQLPAGLQVVAKVLPVWHGVELARAATTGSADFGSVLVHVGVLLAYLGAGCAWGVRAFAGRLTP